MASYYSDIISINPKIACGLVREIKKGLNLFEIESRNRVELIIILLIVKHLSDATVKIPYSGGNYGY
jgi:hypothetical protein